MCRFPFSHLRHSYDLLAQAIVRRQEDKNIFKNQVTKVQSSFTTFLLF